MEFSSPINDEALAALRYEADVRREIVDYFTARDFLQVETPVLLAHTSTEKYLYPFCTELQTLSGKFKQKMFLRFSSELSLKKLLAAGVEKVFELGWVFRNREAEDGARHFPQFCMLEWNEVGIDLQSFILKLQEMLEKLAIELNGKAEIKREGHCVSLRLQDWHCISVREAFLRFAKIDFHSLNDWEDLIPLAKAAATTTIDNFDDAFNWFLLEKIEPALAKLGAVVLWQYPEPAASFAAISHFSHRRKMLPTAGNVDTKNVSSTMYYADRFEVYIAGIELANGFRELTDASQQRLRMEENIDWLEANSVEHTGIDSQFIAAVAKMPPSCGAALGVERLIMLLSGKKTLSKCFPFRENV